MTDQPPCRLVVQRHTEGHYLRWSATCSTHEQKTSPAIPGDFMVWLDMHIEKAKQEALRKQTEQEAPG